MYNQNFEFKKPIVPKQKEHDVALENEPFEKELLSFLSAVKKIDAEKDGGYVPLSALKNLYKEHFGDKGLAENSIGYRAKQASKEISSDETNADIIAERILLNSGQEGNRYFININNKDLLRRIFTPTEKDEELDAIKSEVFELEDQLGIEPLDTTSPQEDF